MNNSAANVFLCIFLGYLETFCISVREMKCNQSNAFPGIKKELNRSRLTEGVPLVLPYCLGDVGGDVFRYRSRGVVILDVGAPCNGTCKEKTIVFTFQ